MNPNRMERLAGYLAAEDRDNAHKTCMEALESGETDIRGLYEDVLAPALNRFGGDESRENETIWREHVLSGIVRGIIEAAFTYVMKEREAKGLACDARVLVFCPAGEDHELGARMAADFFLIWGFQAVFIGANTPEKTLLEAIKRVSPRYLSVSVSNDFNLFAAKRLIADLHSKFGSTLTILAGGRAFGKLESTWAEVGADRHVAGYDDIGRLRAEVTP